MPIPLREISELDFCFKWYLLLLLPVFNAAAQTFLAFLGSSLGEVCCFSSVKNPNYSRDKPSTGVFWHKHPASKLHFFCPVKICPDFPVSKSQEREALCWVGPSIFSAQFPSIPFPLVFLRPPQWWGGQCPHGVAHRLGARTRGQGQFFCGVCPGLHSCFMLKRRWLKQQRNDGGKAEVHWWWSKGYQLSKWTGAEARENTEAGCVVKSSAGKGCDSWVRVVELWLGEQEAAAEAGCGWWGTQPASGWAWGVQEGGGTASKRGQGSRTGLAGRMQAAVRFGSALVWERRSSAELSAFCCFTVGVLLQGH